MLRVLTFLLLAACHPVTVGGDDLDRDGFNEDDCDDFNEDIHPGAQERCNGLDDNCDGNIDEGELFPAFVDADGDGFGAGEPILTCDVGPGQSSSDTDCDDTDRDVHPGAVDACNGVDDDCDGEADPDLIFYYQDGDDDGYGRSDTAREACSPVDGEVTFDGDCDDSDPEIHPNAPDECDDNVDSDCDARDLQCVLGGEHGLSEADTVLVGSTNWGTGEYLAAGDLDGDGLDDIAMTTFYANNNQGGAAVMLGGSSGVLTLSEVGFRVTSSRNTTSAGRSITIGDINNDGFADLAVGAADETCQEWVFYGPISADRAISSADVTRDGIYNTEYGHGSILADINGDGLDDLIVGAYEDDTAGYDAGAVFIEYAPLDAGSASAASTYDVRFLGHASRDMAGRYLRSNSRADVNGDGIPDLLVAAPYARGGAPSSGTAYLVYGGAALADMDLDDADAYFLGEGSGDYAAEGQTIGDINGDGLADLVLGSMHTVSGMAQAGATYVIFGPADQGGSLGESDVIIYGSSAGQLLGLGLDARDLNDDGADELLVGGRGDNGGARVGGAAFLFWGPLAGTATADEADAVFQGEINNGAAGAAVAFANFHEDSVSMAVAAPFDSTGGSQAGAVYLFDFAE